jgi:hypothetical protein
MKKHDERDEHFIKTFSEKRVEWCGSAQSAEQQAYDADVKELRLLTQHDIMFIGTRANANLKLALGEARKKVVQTEEMVNKRPPYDSRLSKFAREWVEMKLLEMKHDKCCIGHLHCTGCGKTVCHHLANYVCAFMPVCQWCDTSVHPNPFNPINAGLLHFPKGAVGLLAEMEEVVRRQQPTI